MSTITIEAPATTEPIEIDVPAISEEEGRRREILLDAALIIEKYGHTCGAGGMRPEGPFCLLGAVGHAAGAEVFKFDGHDSITYEVPTSVISGRKYSSSAGNEYWQWNDQLKYCQLPRKGLFKGRKSTGEIVTETLRRMANGETWEAAKEKSTAGVKYPNWMVDRA